MEYDNVFSIPVQYGSTVDHVHDGLVVRCGGCTRYKLSSNAEPCKSCLKCRHPKAGSEGVSAFEPVDKLWYNRLREFVSEHSDLIDDIARDSLVGGWTTQGFAGIMGDMEKVCKMFGADMPELFKKYTDTNETRNVFILAKRAGIRMVDIADQADYRRYQLFNAK